MTGASVKRRARRAAWLWAFSLCAALGAFGEEAPPLGESYLIPRTVYVGDKARLVSALNVEAPNLVLEGPGQLPQGEGVLILRAAIEGKKLLIDFQPFTAGVLFLPPFTIGPVNCPELQVRVMSILKSGEDLVLSSPAPPLAAPGTGLLIYGAIFGIILTLLAGLGGVLWWKFRFRELWERSVRRRRMRALWRLLRGLRSALVKGKRDEDAALSILSLELRNLLSALTGMNCRAMSAGEFFGLASLPLPGMGDFLCGLFRRCDSLRFSGLSIERGSALGLVEEAGDLVSALARAEGAAGKNRPPAPEVTGGPDEAGEDRQGGGAA